MDVQNGKVLDFLKRWSSTGFWVLTAIPLDDSALTTATFTYETEDQCLQFLEKFNGTQNLYFSVNQPITALWKKTQRADIDRVEWLHVDVDPRPGKDIADEQSRALTLLTSQRPKGIPAPTCIIFSGGGYQAFWKLAEPIVIDGSLEKAEEAKLYNMQLERLFKGDNCHNIDRIMRLPFTLNIPNAKKKKKGRTETLATLFEFNDHAYPLTDFMKAQTVQSSKVDTGGVPKIELSGNIRRIADLSELDKWSVPDRVKVIIVQGVNLDFDEQEKKKKSGDNSRSAWLFDVCCSLVRCSVPAEVVYSIITDPNYAISDSVLELGANSERYAKRQIERAVGFLEDPDLQKLNDTYALVKEYGGKAKIIHEYWSEELEMHELGVLDIGSFRVSYNNQRKSWMSEDGKPMSVKLVDWWLTHPKRKTFERVVFLPGKEVMDSYNLWKGFACEAIPGDCSKFLDHLKDNVCQGNDEYYTYLMGWMARLVQNPATQGQTAVVLRGGMGVGKGFVARVLGSLLGKHYQQVTDPKHIVGSFNAHLRACLLLFADEAFYAGDKRHESNLKTLITEQFRSIEAKGVDVAQAPNFTKVILASNSSWVVPAGDNERRFFVLDVGNAQQQNTEGYFGPILKQMQNGGKEAFLYHLLSHDISQYNVWKIPQTEALQDQKDYTLRTEEAWWLDILEDGSLDDSGKWPEVAAKRAIFEHYLDYCDSMRVTWGRLSHVSFGKKLSTLCPILRDKQYFYYPGDGTKIAAYGISGLQECREFWDKSKGKRTWPQIEQSFEKVKDQDTPF